jgi:molybdopterin molybdotransferase
MGHVEHSPGEGGTVESHLREVEALLERTLQTRPERIALGAALGRVTAEAIASPVDLPLFRNSQMDGVAIRTSDLAGLASRELPIVGEIAAGPAEPHPLEAGTAVRIMTGAVVPKHADAVVPVERTVATEGGVRIDEQWNPGDFIRERGTDLRAGDVIVEADVRLAARHLAALAASGVAEVHVRQRVRVAILTTGEELVLPGETPRPGQLFDANRFSLAALVEEAGGEVSALEHVGDDIRAFAELFDRVRANADLVITSGGISEGAHEVVRETLVPRGAETRHLAMQPGGPQLLGLVDGTPVLGFPGNPVSTQVSFVVFARRGLREAAGLPHLSPEHYRLTESLTSPEGKRQFRRGRRVDEDRVEPIGGASSHLVATMARADVLIEVPDDVVSLKAGDDVRTWPL